MKVNKDYIEINKVKYYPCVPMQLTSEELKNKIDTIDAGTIIYMTNLNILAKVTKSKILENLLTIVKKDKDIPIHNQMYYDEFGWIYRYDAFLYWYDPVKFILNPKDKIYVLQIPSLATNNISNKDNTNIKKEDD